MSETWTAGLLGSLDDLETESPEERKQRRLAWLAELDRIHEQMLKARGGEPIPLGVVDRALDELRGRVDERLD
jgi:hypothetical protein